MPGPETKRAVIAVAAGDIFCFRDPLAAVEALKALLVFGKTVFHSSKILADNRGFKQNFGIVVNFLKRLAEALDSRPEIRLVPK